MNSVVTRPLFLALALAAYPACGGDAGKPATPGETQNGLQGTIGPEGGILAGQPGTELAGIRLEVPRGALSAPTKIVIRETVDPTPLATMAIRVGPQFIVESAAPLTMPAKLTLPADRNLVDGFGQAPSDVKVWARSGEGWELREAIATESGSVTIAFAGSDTVAAGVRVLRADQAVLDHPVINPGAFQLRCADPSGFCMQSLGALSPRPEGAGQVLALDGNSLRYLTNPAANQLAVAVKDLTSGHVTLSQPLSGPLVFPAVFRFNLAVDPSDGTAWLGMGTKGNAHFFPIFVQNIDRVGFGAVTTRDGTFARVSYDGIVARAGTVVGAMKQISGPEVPNQRSPDHQPPIIFAPEVTAGSDRFWIASVNGIRLVSARDAVVHQAVNVDPFNQFGDVTAVAALPDGSVAVRMAGGSARAAIEIIKGGAIVATVPLPDRVTPFDMAADAQGNLWITIANMPVVAHRNTSGQLRFISLLTGLENPVPIPTWVRARSDGTAIVETVGFGLIQIIPAG